MLTAEECAECSTLTHDRNFTELTKNKTHTCLEILLRFRELYAFSFYALN